MIIIVCFDVWQYIQRVHCTYTKQIVQEFEDHTERKYALAAFELYFKVDTNTYEFENEKTTKVIRLSTAAVSNTNNLNHSTTHCETKTF